MSDKPYRWRIWFQCLDCERTLNYHDPKYMEKHDTECPVAARHMTDDLGFGPEWRQHIWQQQELVPHECASDRESLVACEPGLG